MFTRKLTNETEEQKFYLSKKNIQRDKSKTTCIQKQLLTTNYIKCSGFFVKVSETFLKKISSFFGNVAAYRFVALLKEGNSFSN